MYYASSTSIQVHILGYILEWLDGTKRIELNGILIYDVRYVDNIIVLIENTFTTDFT